MAAGAGILSRHGGGHFGVDLGVEPAISIGTRRSPEERRAVSTRWLCATILTGLAGAGLIGAATYTTLDRKANFAQAPDFAVLARTPRDSQDAGLHKGDRLIKRADVVAEKQSFSVPTAVTVGDKQVIRLRGYTHVATTLTLAPTELADQVPAFNPLKLLASDQAPLPDTASDPGPTLDSSEVAFVVHDLTNADASLYSGGLQLSEVQAQVAQVAQAFKAAKAPGDVASLPLPPQLLLMRTSRAGLPDALGAFGYADPVSRMASPFSSINVRMVPENVTVAPRAESLHDISQPEEKLVVMHHGESLETILAANGATREQIRAIVAAFGAKRGEPPVGEGRRLKILLADLNDGSKTREIARLSVYLDETLETTVAVDDAGRYVQVHPAGTNPTASRPATDDSQDDNDSGGMRLYDSLYQTALKQQIPTPIIDTMVRIFSNDVDFQQAVQGGDSLDALYSNADSGDGPQSLLFASLTVRNDIYRYYRFQTPDGSNAEYFDDNGRSVSKFLIRKPVPNGIFTSPFGMRFHPILGYSRPHTGVDWAAPVGTPILAAGNGTILKAEHSPSYGNHIEIQHANDYITTYSHMVGFARGMREGVKVRQGQVIGYLGQTGLATGPHLHYEVIVNGHFVDPMRVKLAQTRGLDGKQLAEFKHEHERIDGLMANAPNAVESVQNHAAN